MPRKIFDKLNDKEQKNECGIKLFTFILCFYHEYDRNNFIDELKTEDLIAKKYINESLLIYQYLFSDIKLNKEKVKELIEISKTYTDLTNSLKYLNTLLELLDIVLSFFEKFKDLYIEEKKKKKGSKNKHWINN